MARYRKEMTHLLHKEESPAKSKLPKPTLQKLGPNDDTQQIVQALQSPSDEELDYHSDSSTGESEPECT